MTIQSFNLVIFDLTHFECLLFIQFFSLFNLLIDKILLSLFSNILFNLYINYILPCFFRYYCMRSSSYLYFWVYISFNCLFFSLISLISFLFCIFLYLLSLYFYYSYLIASSAFICNNFPSSIYSLYWLICFFITCLFCFRRFFSKSFNLFFYSSFFNLYYYYPFFTLAYMKWSLRLFLHGIVILSFFRFLLDISSFLFAHLDLGVHQIREVYYSKL